MLSMIQNSIVKILLGDRYLLKTNSLTKIFLRNNLDHVKSDCYGLKKTSSNVNQIIKSVNN